MKDFFKNLVCLAIVIVVIIGGIYTTFQIIPEEVDYSVDYALYRSLETTTNVDDLRHALQSMQLEYSLSDNVFEIKEYPNIKFNILDDKTCSIATDKVMENFAYLDSDSIVDVTITTTKEANKIVETLTKKDASASYIKKGNLYFVKANIPSIVIVPIVIAIVAIGVFVYYLMKIISLISKSKNNKSNSNAKTGATPPSQTKSKTTP